MTPSEIAAWLSDEARYRNCGHTRYAQASATIRDLEDERDALVVGYTNIQYSRSEDRAKLKIATEALEYYSSKSVWGKWGAIARQALARIKDAE